MTKTGAETLIEVKNLKKYFTLPHQFLKKEKRQIYAVDDVSFEIRQGETLGLVGESGCGKSTTGRTMLRLLEPTGGEVYFKGQNVYEMSKADVVKLRQKMQIIFQDPYGSLNPRMTVEQIIGEAVQAHGLVEKDALHDYVLEIMGKCGINFLHANRYPHEFSGGQRQRIGIARALALNPEFIVADEPVSALDVSIRAQILNLIMDLQQEMGLTYLFISHDLSVVKHISDRVGVMYLGSLVELTDSESIYRNPLHPYTQALLSAIPKDNPKTKKEQIILTGDLPSPATRIAGCKFSTRCAYCQDRCKEERPPFREVQPGRQVACHRAEEFIQ